MTNDAADGTGIDWRVTPGLTPYADALAAMEARAAAVAAGTQRELVWLLEHPPVYTAGTSADPAELIDARFPVVAAGRGGRYTYHGPGQRVGYLVLDLNARGRDVRRFVHALEGWVIDALEGIGIAAHRSPGRVGIWIDLDDGPGGAHEAKIGAIGVRVRRWVTLHGFSVNCRPTCRTSAASCRAACRTPSPAPPHSANPRRWRPSTRARVGIQSISRNSFLWRCKRGLSDCSLAVNVHFDLGDRGRRRTVQIRFQGSFPMRALFTKAVAGSMIAGAALMVSACGSKTTDNTTDNTMVTDMNATEGMDTMTDNMTTTDGSMGNGAMMSNDTMMSNSGMMSNDTMMTNTTGNTM